MKQAACLQGPASRRSAAVKARRSRLAEHGASRRRAHGLDGETGVIGSPCQASPTPTTLFDPHLFPDRAQDRNTHPCAPRNKKEAARSESGLLELPLSSNSTQLVGFLGVLRQGLRCHEVQVALDR